MKTECLPDQVWHAVFAQLDYFDLKVCQRVNKHFKALTASSTHDVMLFRAGKPTPEGYRQLAYYQPHPTLAHCQIRSSTMYAVGHSNKKFRLVKSNAANEFLTYPPVDSLVLEVGDDQFYVENLKGVTVAQAFRAISKRASPTVTQDLLIDIPATFRCCPRPGSNNLIKIVLKDLRKPSTLPPILFTNKRDYRKVLEEGEGDSDRDNEDDDEESDNRGEWDLDKTRTTLASTPTTKDSTTTKKLSKVGVD